MPGGRFQAPAEACLSSLEGSLSVSRRSGSEAWGQAASSLSATPGPEQPRPPSASRVSRAEGARRAPGWMLPSRARLRGAVTACR